VAGTLVLDILGRECAVGSGGALIAITATYIVDGGQSTGKYAGASGVGPLAGRRMRAFRLS
jgi:hypothetical protein